MKTQLSVTMTEDDDDDDIDDGVEVDSDVFDDDVNEYWRGCYHLIFEYIL